MPKAVFYAFVERTGIAPEHLRFCFEHHEKAAHCRELGLLLALRPASKTLNSTSLGTVLKAETIRAFLIEDDENGAAKIC